MVEPMISEQDVTRQNGVIRITFEPITLDNVCQKAQALDLLRQKFIQQTDLITPEDYLGLIYLEEAEGLGLFRRDLQTPQGQKELQLRYDIYTELKIKQEWRFYTEHRFEFLPWDPLLDPMRYEEAPPDPECAHPGCSAERM